MLCLRPFFQEKGLYATSCLSVGLFAKSYRPWKLWKKNTVWFLYLLWNGRRGTRMNKEIPKKFRNRPTHYTGTHRDADNTRIHNIHSYNAQRHASSGSWRQFLLPLLLPQRLLLKRRTKKQKVWRLYGMPVHLPGMFGLSVRLQLSRRSYKQCSSFFGLFFQKRFRS